MKQKGGDALALPITAKIITDLETGNGLERLFQSEAQISAQADQLVSGAMAQLARYSGDQRIANMRSERAARIHSAFPALGDLRRPVVAYLTAVAHTAAGKATDLRLAVKDAASILVAIKDLMERSGNMGFALRQSLPNDTGKEIGDCADVASAHLLVAWREAACAVAAMEQAAALAPASARGQSGLMGKLRVPPQRALADALATLWSDRGLNLDGGEAGDGLDVVLYTLIGSSADDLLTKIRSETVK